MMTMVRVPTKLWKRVQNLADKDRRSASQELAILLEEALDRAEKKKGSEQ